MENTLSIAIVGMGLIGGSLGLAIKKRTGHTVIGIDRDEKVMEAVLSSGAADKSGRSRSVDSGFRSPQCDKGFE